MREGVGLGATRWPRWPGWPSCGLLGIKRFDSAPNYGVGGIERAASALVYVYSLDLLFMCLVVMVIVFIIILIIN